MLRMGQAEMNVQKPKHPSVILLAHRITCCCPRPQGQLYVSTLSELVEVPVANCTNYQSCGECILSRDPYCGWNGRQCVDIRSAPANKYELVCSVMCHLSLNYFMNCKYMDR